MLKNMDGILRRMPSRILLKLIVSSLKDSLFIAPRNDATADSPGGC